jgi:hypothetical protein
MHRVRKIISGIRLRLLVFITNKTKISKSYRSRKKKSINYKKTFLMKILKTMKKMKKKYRKLLESFKSSL